MELTHHLRDIYFLNRRSFGANLLPYKNIHPLETVTMLEKGIRE